MAVYQPTTSATLTRKLQATAADMYVESIYETFFGSRNLIDSTGNNVVKLFEDLSKEKGDQITVPMLMQLTGAGKTEGQALVGNEEALSYNTDSVYINELRHAVNVPGSTSIYDQRLNFSQYESAKPLLQTWFRQRLDVSMFNQLCAYTPQTDTKYTGLNAVTSIDSSHIVRPSTITDDTNLTASHIFTLDLVDKALNKAVTLSNNPLRPITVGGDEYYILFIHPHQQYNMVTSTSTGGWLDLAKSKITGGYLAESGIANGALGIYKNVIIHSTPRITAGVDGTTPTTAASSARRAVLCGAGALQLAFGNAYPNMGEDGLPIKFNEEIQDYGEYVGVAAGTIFGAKAATFSIGGTSTSYGRILISTYAVAP